MSTIENIAKKGVFAAVTVGFRMINRFFLSVDCSVLPIQLASICFFKSKTLHNTKLCKTNYSTFHRIALDILHSS